jgi:hypothetical protein
MEPPWKFLSAPAAKEAGAPGLEPALGREQETVSAKAWELVSEWGSESAARPAMEPVLAVEMEQALKWALRTKPQSPVLR